MDLVLSADNGNSLRRWGAEDAEAVVAAFADPLMSTQVAEPLETSEAALRWIDQRLEAWRSGEAFSWVVVDGDTLVGSVTVAEIDRSNDIGWASYWTAPWARGKGVASSSLRALSDWAFAHAGLFRLELGHRTNNPASCRVALAAGYTVEGLERQKLRYGEERFDVELHARLATDPPPESPSIPG